VSASGWSAVDSAQGRYWWNEETDETTPVGFPRPTTPYLGKWVTLEPDLRLTSLYHSLFLLLADDPTFQQASGGGGGGGGGGSFGSTMLQYMVMGFGVSLGVIVS
jgi:hypothetical protein